jgi:hypothetical protein
MSLFRITQIFLLLTSAGCSGLGDHYTVTLDPTFTPAQQEAALDAANAWSRAVPVTLDVVIAVCAGRRAENICIHSSDAATVSKAMGDGEMYLGATAGPNWKVDGAEIFISTAYMVQIQSEEGAWLTQEVFAHEMGHAMGLVHVNGIGALMDKSAPDSSHGPVEAVDAEQWLLLRDEERPVESNSSSP